MRKQRAPAASPLQSMLNTLANIKPEQLRSLARTPAGRKAVMEMAAKIRANTDEMERMVRLGRQIEAAYTDALDSTAATLEA